MRQIIRDNERLLRLLFLINAPGSDWTVNEAYQERAFQAEQGATQGKESSADAGGGAMVTVGEASPQRSASLEEKAAEKRCDEERMLCQIEAEAVAAAKTDQHNDQAAASSPGVYGVWKSPRGKVTLTPTPTLTPTLTLTPTPPYP